MHFIVTAVRTSTVTQELDLIIRSLGLVHLHHSFAWDCYHLQESQEISRETTTLRCVQTQEHHVNNKGDKLKLLHVWKRNLEKAQQDEINKKKKIHAEIKSAPKDTDAQNRTKWLLGKGKAIPLQAWTGPVGSRRMRFPDFKTIGT